MKLPEDTLTFAAFIVPSLEIDGLSDLVASPTVAKMEAFARAHADLAFNRIGVPYAAHTHAGQAELPQQALAQYWERDGMAPCCAHPEYRVAPGKFSIASKKGANVLFLHRGDPAFNTGPALLMYLTLPGQETKPYITGDQNVYVLPLEFLDMDVARPAFAHTREHVMGQCTANH